MRSIFLFASVLAACALAPGALADPILECGLLAGEKIAGRTVCAPSSTSVIAPLIEAQDLALGRARQLDERTGTEVAVLGVEASQQAWEAYRDVECQTLGVSLVMQRRRKRRSSPVRSGSPAHVPTPCCT